LCNYISQSNRLGSMALVIRKAEETESMILAGIKQTSGFEMVPEQQIEQEDT